jgi:hypothetical protein
MNDNDWDTITIDLSDEALNSTLLNDMAYTVTTPSSTWLNGAVGSSGQVYTVTSTNGSSASWADTITLNNDIKGASLQVKGDAEFEGDVTIKGKSIVDSLERIEERLAILRPNEELEEKWENLRALRNAYKELEAEIIEKEKIWSILKR